MKTYRKIPIENKAIQLTEKNILEVYKEVHRESPNLNTAISSEKWSEYEDNVLKNGMHLITPESGEGAQIASIGNYIVFGYTKQLGRHCWPVKPDYFEQSYELVK